LEIYHLVLDRPPLILFFLLLSDCRDADNRAEIVMSAKVRCGARKQLEPLLVPESVFGLHQLSERYIDWTSKITRAMTSTLRHPLLGSICGRKVTSDLIQYSGIPYASIVQRFARSTTLSNLPTTSSRGTFDATDPGPDSVQPCNATEIDAKGNQFPHCGFKESPQSEDCLSLNITTTSTSSSSGLPVIVFLHGGAFFLGSSTRPYYSPLNLLDRAVQTDHPLVFVSINYRLGALGFLHSSEVPHILPPNNALHDQLRAFDWIHQNIAGFGGDPELLPDKMVAVIQEWRDRILRFMCDGDEPWDEWDETDGKALRVDRDGTRVETRESYLSEDCDRRKRLLELASRENGQDGCDFLWEGVCRTWLDS